MSDGSVTLDTRLAYDQLKKDLKGLKTTISKSLPSASSSLSAMSKGFENVGKAATSAGKACTAMTAGLIGGLGIAISRFDTLNNYPKVLSNLGFSAEEAEKSIQDLSKGIDGLPTALDDAASGVQRLVAKNNDIEKSTKYFLAMNDAIVAGNAPAQQQASAIEQLTQAYSKGKPDLMEWRTLMMAMPGQLKQIATSMGYVSADALYEALNKGKVSMDTFMDAVVKLDEEGADGIISFQEQAKNSCDSIGTAITNVSNRFKKGFATILGSMNEAAKDTSFGSVAGMINNFSNSVKNFLDRIGTAIKDNESFKNLMTSMANNLKILEDKINGLSDEQLNAIINAIINIVKIGPKLLILGKTFSIVGGTLKGFSSGIETLSKIHKNIKMVSEAFKNLQKAGTFINIATNAIKLLKIAFAALTSSVGLVVIAIVAVIAIFVMLWNKCEWFRNFWIKLWENLKSTAISFANFFVKTIPEKFNSFKTTVSNIISSVVTFFNELPSKIWNGLTNFITKISEWVVNLKEKMVGGVQSMIISVVTFFQQLPYTIGYIIGFIVGKIIQFGMDLNTFATTKIPEFIENVITFFSELPSKIWNWLTEAFNKIIEWGTNIIQTGQEKALEFIETVIKFFKDLPEEIWTWLWNTIQKIKIWGTDIVNIGVERASQFLASVIKFFSELPSKIWGHLLNAVEKIISWGKDMVEKGRIAAEDLVKVIFETISKLPEKIKEVGKNIVEGLWEGIKGAGSWIAEKVGDFAKGILDGMKEALGIHSPSRLFRDEVGKYIALGVGEGFTDNIAKVYKKMKASVDFETQRISTKLATTATIKAQNSGTKTIYNNNDKGISVNQNFYEKNQSPYEIGKETKNSLRRFAYGY